MVNLHVHLVKMGNILQQLELVLVQFVQHLVMEIVLNQQENVIVVKLVMDIQLEHVVYVQQVLIH